MGSIWVRSQDKIKMFLVDNIAISKAPYSNGKLELSTICDGNSKILGMYSTLDKCLKVLDMFQEVLTPKLIIDVDGRFEQTSGDTVFVMPQDDEVIVCG